MQQIGLKKPLQIILFFLLIFSVPKISSSYDKQQETSWYGNYRFEENLGKDIAGTTTLFVTYNLKVYKSKTKMLALVDVDGFQTYESFLCEVKPEGKKLKFFFIKDVIKMFPLYCKKGDLLFTLEKQRMKNKDRYLVCWKKYVANTDTKSYFEKLR